MCVCVCPRSNLKTTADYLLSVCQLRKLKKSLEQVRMSRSQVKVKSHVSEGSNSLGKVMSYSAAGSEIPFLMSSFSSH